MKISTPKTNAGSISDGIILILFGLLVGFFLITSFISVIKKSFQTIPDPNNVENVNIPGLNGQQPLSSDDVKREQKLLLERRKDRIR